MGYIILVTQLYQKDVDPVWLRSSVHVSCVFILQAIWLTADHSFNRTRPTQNCVPNTGVGKATLPCFCRGCCSENTANNNFLYQKKLISPICSPPLVSPPPHSPPKQSCNRISSSTASLVSSLCPPPRSFPVSTSNRPQTISSLLLFLSKSFLCSLYCACLCNAKLTLTSHTHLDQPIPYSLHCSSCSHTDRTQSPVFVAECRLSPSATDLLPL